MIGITDIRFIRGARAGRTQQDLSTFVKLEYGDRNVEWFIADGGLAGRPSDSSGRGDGSHRGDRSIAALALAVLLRFGRRTRGGPHVEPVSGPATDDHSDSTAPE